MRNAGKVSVLAIVVMAVALTAVAQQKAVHFKKLQEFLPTTDITGYTRAKPTGETTNAMGMSTSEASVRYDKKGAKGPEGEAANISVTISDVIGMPMGAMGLSLVANAEFENETETGYEKSVKVQGYPGKESVDNGEYKSAEITVAVADRFLVTLKHEGSADPDPLHKLLDAMKLADLGKLAK